MKRNLHFKTSGTLFLLSAVLLLMTLCITSCSKKSDAVGTSYIKFTNAAETASPIDFYVNSKKENDAALTYNQGTDYFAITSVTQPALIKSSASGATVASFQVSPQTGAYYSVYYFEGSTVAYPDDLTAPKSGKARVRFINLNLGLVENTNFGVSGGAKVVAGLVNKVASNYYDVDPATTFSVDTTTTSTASPILNIPTTIQAGHIYTVYLSGQSLGSLMATVSLQK
ncbi:MAG: hypothetical protein JWR50_3192 [Mucilaginibacter sp.]|nr:hypothetical protein [Mucilaginibacter sp.]